MKKAKLVSGFVLLALVLSLGTGTVLADDPRPEQPVVVLSSDTCAGTATDDQLQMLAEAIVKEQVSQQVRECYAALDIESKVRLFEAIVERRGLSVDELRKEVSKDSMTLPPSTTRGVDWNQLIEHTSWDLTEPPVYSNGWWQDNSCDDDPGDVDYVFYFSFPASVSDPDRLRNNSLHLAVDSMLLYYQAVHGGIKGEGNTSSPSVRTCLGGAGVSGAGGPQTVYSHMRLMLKK